MAEPDPVHVVVSISTQSGTVEVFAGFEDEDEAKQFVQADIFPEDVDQIAIVPLRLVKRVESPEQSDETA